MMEDDTTSAAAYGCDSNAATLVPAILEADEEVGLGGTVGCSLPLSSQAFLCSLPAYLATVPKSFLCKLYSSVACISRLLRYFLSNIILLATAHLAGFILTLCSK